MAINKEKTIWLTLANLLTLARLLVTPFVVHALVHGNLGTALCLFALAAVTDMADGFAARTCGAESQVGRLLDPIADKCLLMGTVLGCAVSLPIELRMVLLPLWLVVLLVAREVGMLVGAALMRWHQPSFILAPSWAGKLATFVQLVLLGLLLASAASEKVAHFASYMAFLPGIVGCLTVLATAVYGWRVVQHFGRNG